MENTNTVNEQEQTPVVEKTFTQDEVNKIVQERIYKDRKDRQDYDELKAKAEKYDALEEASKTELQKATERAERLEAENTALKRANELRQVRETVSTETGVPMSLLTGEDEATCREQANGILAFKNPSNYPSLRDGGETTTKVKPTSKQQFEEWLANT